MLVICPFCSTDNDRVIDSRASDGGTAVRRRRECIACGKRFTTYERLERTARLMVVKKDGTRVAFDVENILRGIQAACGKRPVSEEAKAGISHAVEEEIHREFDHEVPSAVIGERVAARLRDVDPIAYVRYAIEYYGLKTLDEVMNEIADLKARPRNLPNQVDLFQAR
jgi:transcriptional repressor NrdR